MSDKLIYYCYSILLQRLNWTFPSWLHKKNVKVVDKIGQRQQDIKNAHNKTQAITISMKIQHKMKRQKNIINSNLFIPESHPGCFY